MQFDGEIANAAAAVFCDIFRSHRKVLDALDPNVATSMIKRVESVLRSSDSTNDAIFQQTFQHNLFATFVNGDCTFRSAVRKAARAFFEESISNICVDWLMAIPAPVPQNSPVPYLRDFEKLMRPFMRFK